MLDILIIILVALLLLSNYLWAVFFFSYRASIEREVERIRRAK